MPKLCVKNTEITRKLFILRMRTYLRLTHLDYA